MKEEEREVEEWGLVVFAAVSRGQRSAFLSSCFLLSAQKQPPKTLFRISFHTDESCLMIDDTKRRREEDCGSLVRCVPSLPQFWDAWRETTSRIIRRAELRSVSSFLFDFSLLHQLSNDFQFTILWIISKWVKSFCRSRDRSMNLRIMFLISNIKHLICSLSTLRLQWRFKLTKTYWSIRTDLQKQFDWQMTDYRLSERLQMNFID